MSTMISNQQANDIAAEKRKRTDAEVSALTSGVDTSKVNLKVYRGNRYFGVIFTAEGLPAYKVDPDDGNRLMRKLTGDSGWQFVDALYGELKAAGPGHKVIAWQWDEVGKEYVVSRTKYRDGVAIRPAGILDELVERKMQKISKVSMPGLFELSFLSDEISKITKEIKADKEHVKKGVAVFTKAHKTSLMRYSVGALKGIGMEKSEALRLLAEEWPELFAKEEKQHK